MFNACVSLHMFFILVFLLTDKIITVSGFYSFPVKNTSSTDLYFHYISDAKKLEKYEFFKNVSF